MLPPCRAGVMSLEGGGVVTGLCCGGGGFAPGRFGSGDWVGLYGSDKVGPETSWVVVAFIQREPGDGPPTASDPFAQQRRLAKAGRGGDERQLALKARGQPFEQTWARHQPCPEPCPEQSRRGSRRIRPNGRDMQFGPQERDVLSVAGGWRGHLTFPDGIAHRTLRTRCF